MDPRVKLLILILFDIFVIIKDALVLHLITFLVITLVGISFYRKGFTGFIKGLLPMTLTIFIIGYVFISSADALLLVLRFSELTMASYIFFSLTDSDEIAKALLGIGIPYNFVFIFTSAMRYIELVGVKFREIKEAQKGRGMDIRFRNFHAILIPLIVGIFVLADELAEALESRGFTCKNRTFYKPLRWKVRDTIVAVGTTIVFLGMVLYL